MLTLLREVQIPLLAALLLGACASKFVRVLQAKSMAAGLGPTALFPLKLRKPAAIAMCATEFGCGIGLIVTASKYGNGTPATLVRLATCLLFLVATAALIELRSVRPDIGCGCFGEFSTAPVTWRTIARSALLAVAALVTVRLRPPPVRTLRDSAGTLVLTLVVELAIFALLSPEIREIMVRIGYSAPCELRVVSTEQTLAVLKRSAQWRKHFDLIANRDPTDVWRELCWRYVAYPSRAAGKDAELVFAVRLDHHRKPVVLSALVDTATGAVLPWPAGSAKHARARHRARAERQHKRAYRPATGPVRPAPRSVSQAESSWPGAGGSGPPQ
jgi:hypothetical protein